tara:strand:+ start:133 stop:1560 length:1428 start_codon:yes stop_codon:yes gene_type:complete
MDWKNSGEMCLKNKNDQYYFEAKTYGDTCGFYTENQQYCDEDRDANDDTQFARQMCQECGCNMPVETICFDGVSSDENCKVPRFEGVRDSFFCTYPKTDATKLSHATAKCAKAIPGYMACNHGSESVFDTHSIDGPFECKLFEKYPIEALHHRHTTIVMDGKGDSTKKIWSRSDDKDKFACYYHSYHHEEDVGKTIAHCKKIEKAQEYICNDFMFGGPLPEEGENSGVQGEFLNNWPDGTQGLPRSKYPKVCKIVESFPTNGVLLQQQGDGGSWVKQSDHTHIRYAQHKPHDNDSLGHTHPDSVLNTLAWTSDAVIDGTGGTLEVCPTTEDSWSQCGVNAEPTWFKTTEENPNYCDPDNVSTKGNIQNMQRYKNYCPKTCCEFRNDKATKLQQGKNPYKDGTTTNEIVLSNQAADPCGTLNDGSLNCPDFAEKYCGIKHAWMEENCKKSCCEKTKNLQKDTQFLPSVGEIGRSGR